MTLDDWIIEWDGTDRELSTVWRPVQETFFYADAEAARKEEEYWAKKRQLIPAKPRALNDCIEILKERRTRDLWDGYRFRNIKTGDVILAWVMR